MLNKLALSAIPPQAKIGIVVGILVSVFFAGWKVNGWRLSLNIEQMKLSAAEAAVEVYKQTMEINNQSVESSNTVGIEFANTATEIQIEERVVIKEVIRYVENNTDNACELDPEWVRLDTISATGMPDDSTTSLGVDGATEGFTDVDLLPVIVERNSVCRYEIEKLKALQQYVREQREIFNR